MHVQNKRVDRPIRRAADARITFHWNRLIAVAVLLAACAFWHAQAFAANPTPYTYSGNLKIDIGKVPFSRYGSYMGISERSQGIYLRSFHGGGKNAFQLQLIGNGQSIPFTVSASPTLLTLASKEGRVEICFQGPDRLRIRGKGVGLRLIAEPDSLATEQSPSQWEVNGATKYLLWSIQGLLKMDDPWNGTSNPHVIATFQAQPGEGDFEAEIDTYVSAWQPHPVQGTFDSALKMEEQSYADWLTKVPQVPVKYGPGAELAAYINWESVVQPDGHFKRPAMLMSKNWMTNVWSWDQCFNAMAMSFKDPKLAWDQYMLPIDNQDPNGVFPDGINDQDAYWKFTKPPIHGWALNWMLQNGHFNDKAHLEQVYEPLVRWTNWYFQFRDANHDGLPEYRNGNDSGWDNSTVMLSGVPVETPDLSAYLVLQMDTLARIAQSLGKQKEAEQWRSRSDELLKKMLAKFWKGDHFVAFRIADGGEVNSGSLLLYLPLALGKRLPPDVQQKLIEGLTRPGRFRTAHGFSSEALASKYYTPDGYWRGPIWAPTTMLLADGLDSAGRHQLAKNLRMDFCAMAQQSGMSENFNAVTGKGLRDPAYTWTSSVYLIFAHQLLQE